MKSRKDRLIRLYLLSILEHRKAMFKEETKGLGAEEVLTLALKKMENSQ